MALERVDVPGQDLYDGVEDGLWDRTFALPVDGLSFSVAELDGGFPSLRERLGDAAFEQLVADPGIRRSHGAFTDARGLSLDVLVRGGCVFLLAIGEVSPGRYRLALHSVWRIA